MKTSIYCLAVLFIFSSCLNMLAKKTGVKEKGPHLTEIKMDGHQVLFLGMRHIGIQEFYDSTKNLIVDLENKGFKVYAEGSKTIVDGNIITDTIHAKKFRKIAGIDPTIKYADIQNSILVAFYEKFKIVNQPSYPELGSTNYKIVDIPYENLIDRYENKYGEIIFDSCDYRTELGKIYPCKTLSKSLSKSFREEFILDQRNKFVSQAIKNSSDQKILIIYGLDHLDGMKKYLESAN